MAKHRIGARDAFRLSKEVTHELVDRVDNLEFRRECSQVQRKGFPLRYQSARYVAPKSEEDANWIDPKSPFGYKTVSQGGENSLEESNIYIDISGYRKRHAIINNIHITNIDGFGLTRDDPLAEIVRDLVKKQDEEFLERLEKHKDRLRRLRAHHGPRDKRYLKALKEEPKQNSIVDIARNEVEHLFLSVEFMKQYFQLVGLDLENRTMSFGIELGTGGPGKMSRYFGLLEVGVNPRWDEDACMIFSTYAKAPGSSRVLHPYMLHKGDFRKDSGFSTFSRFLARAMLRMNETQEFFEQYSTDVAAYYKKTFPFSAVPVRLVLP